MARPLRVGIIGLAHLHPRTYMPHFEATPTTEVVAASDPIPMLREGFERDFVLTRSHAKRGNQKTVNLQFSISRCCFVPGSIGES